MIKVNTLLKILSRRKIVMFMQVSWNRLGSTQLPNHRLTQLVATTWNFLLKRSFPTLEIKRNLLQWNFMLNGWTTIQTIIHGNHGNPCAPQINFIRICAITTCCTLFQKDFEIWLPIQGKNREWYLLKITPKYFFTSITWVFFYGG